MSVIAASSSNTTTWQPGQALTSDLQETIETNVNTISQVLSQPGLTPRKAITKANSVAGSVIYELAGGTHPIRPFPEEYRAEAEFLRKTFDNSIYSTPTLFLAPTPKPEWLGEATEWPYTKRIHLSKEILNLLRPQLLQHREATILLATAIYKLVLENPDLIPPWEYRHLESPVESAKSLIRWSKNPGLMKNVLQEEAGPAENLCKHSIVVKHEAINGKFYAINALQKKEGRAVSKCLAGDEIAQASVHRKPSIADTWASKSAALAGHIYLALDQNPGRRKALEIHTLVQNMLRYEMPSTFPPTAALGLLHLLETLVDQADLVQWQWLDPSAGWGDRLVAALSADKVLRYTGVDPNSALVPRYEQICHLFRKHISEQPATDVTMIRGAAEDQSEDSIGGGYNVVFTSTPYFDCEKYSQDADQSYLRYSTMDEWTQGFLARMLEITWRALQPQGFLALNLQDLQHSGRRKRFLLVDELHKRGNELLGARYIGTVRLRLNTNVHEPILIWQKVDTLAKAIPQACNSGLKRSRQEEDSSMPDDGSEAKPTAASSCGWGALLSQNPNKKQC